MILPLTRTLNSGLAASLMYEFHLVMWLLYLNFLSNKDP